MLNRKEERKSFTNKLLTPKKTKEKERKKGKKKKKGVKKK